MDIFEQAARLKLRFENTGRGELAVENLFDLSLPSLDTLAKTVNKKLKDAEEESFISAKSKTNEELTLKLEVVKHVIAVKQQEAELRKAYAQRQAERELLISLKEKKQVEALEGLSVEEIEARLTRLG